MANNLPSTSFHSSENYSIVVVFDRCSRSHTQPPHHVSLRIVAHVCLKSPTASSHKMVYCTEHKLTLPSQQLQCGTTIKNYLDLMNIPFSLDEKLVWWNRSNACKILENYQDLIIEMVTEFRDIQAPSKLKLVLIKSVVVSEDEYEKWESLLNNNRDHYIDLIYKEPMNQMLWRMRALEVLERVDGHVDDDCSICLTDMVVGKLIKLPCLHVFHEGCILKWLKNGLNCPYCRGTCPSIEIVEVV